MPLAQDSKMTRMKGSVRLPRRLGADRQGRIACVASLDERSQGRQTCRNPGGRGRRMGHVFQAREAITVLTEVVVNDSDKFTRCYAAIALGRIGGVDATASIPSLAKVLGKSDTPDEVRTAIADVLGQFGTCASEAVPELATLLKDKQPEVRLRRAAVALARVGPSVKTVMPALKEALGDDDRSVRCSVVRAIGNIGADARDLVPDLVKRLGDDSLEVRIAAIEEIGNIGPEAKAAVTALTVAAKDGTPAIRNAAQEVLKKITGMMP